MSLGSIATFAGFALLVHCAWGVSNCESWACSCLSADSSEVGCSPTPAVTLLLLQTETC